MAKAVFNPHTFAIATLTLLLLAAGCTSKSLNGVDPDLASSNDLREIAGSRSTISSLSLIARDFAHILPQIPELKPEQIILSVLAEADANTDFAEALRQALFLEGYAVRLGRGNFLSTSLTYQITESEGQESGLLENEPQRLLLKGLAALGQRSSVNSPMRIKATLPLGSRERLVVMEYRGNDYLLGVSSGNISKIDSHTVIESTHQKTPPHT